MLERDEEQAREYLERVFALAEKEYNGTIDKEKARVEKLIGGEEKIEETDWVKVETGGDTTPVQMDNVQVDLCIVDHRKALELKREKMDIVRYKGVYAYQSKLATSNARLSLSWEQYQNLERVSMRELKTMNNTGTKKERILSKKERLWVQYCKATGVYITLQEWSDITFRNESDRENLRKKIIENNNRKFPKFNQSLFHAYCQKGDPMYIQLSNI